MSRLARLVSLALLVGAAPVAVAQTVTGTITGHVTDTDLHRPVANAQVVLVGTTIGTRTDASGAYRLGGVPAGSVTLRISLLGFQSTTRTVGVTAGATTTLDLGLTVAPTILSVVTTTASGTEQARRENGASVATVNADTLSKAAIQNFSEVLSGRTAGVTVTQSSGTTGGGARIRIRGSNSVSLSNEPLLIIDGVRIDNNPNSSSIDIGGQSPSRLNDINPEDIESFDVIKGPAASALYGTAAANGVIQITTKRGVAGHTTWNTFGELGSVVENNPYPPNYGGWTKTPLYDIPGFASGAPNPSCNLYYQAFGNCTIDSLQAYNTILESHPFRTGRRQKIGANVAGGTQAITYFLSSDVEKEGGVYRTSNLDRLNLRGNLGTHPSKDIDLQISTGYVQSNLQLPQNDNNYFGVISDGLAGFPGNGPTQGYNPIGPDQFENIDTRQDIGRFTGGANGTWRILPWLAANATLGLDVVNRFDSETLQPNLVFFSDSYLGERTSNRFETSNVTTNYALTARNSLTARINSVAQVGYQFQRTQDQGTSAFGKTLTAGTGSLTGVNSDKALSENYSDNKTAGGFVSEQLSYNDKLYVTGTLRADKNSAFGQNFGLAKYPAASLSYVVTEGGDRLSQFRLRSAYGVSGLRPGVLDAIAYSNPVSVRLDSANVAGITVGNFANPTLKAERTREFELGFDAGFLRDRASVEFTYYDKKSTNALVLRPLPLSLGGPTSQFANLGAVTNRGLELTVNATPIQMDRVQLGLTLTASNNKNNLVSLGDLPPIIFGDQRHVPGYPLGGYWGTTVDSVHVSADGSVNPDSVFFTTSSSKARFLGSALPTRQGSLSGDLTLFHIVRIYNLLEYRGGNKLENATEQFRCSFSLCRGINDKTASVEEQANAEAAFSNSSFVGGYIEDASFVKWRELSVAVTVPQRYLGSLRTTNATVTFGARNLHTWTKYKGLDPEVNGTGQSNFTTDDFLTQPQVRYYTARLNLTF
jgi:TonB-dependent starch-binding outer membrane protein SusC